jgi:hypothetical protein
MKDLKFGNWLPLFIALTAAINGWLLLGPFAQATLTGAALLRRLRSTGKSMEGAPLVAQENTKVRADTFVQSPKPHISGVIVADFGLGRQSTFTGET